MKKIIFEKIQLKITWNIRIFSFQFDSFGSRYEIKSKKHFWALSSGQRCPPWNSNLEKPYRYVIGNTDLHGNVDWLPWHSLNEAFYIIAKLLKWCLIKTRALVPTKINLILNIDIKLKCRRTHVQNSHSEFAPPRGHLLVEKRTILAIFLWSYFFKE